MKKRSDFVNHHMHSFFSSLDGMPSPDDILERITELGQRSFTITDHGSLSAIPAAYRAAQKAGVGFTPGIEAYFTHDRFNRSRDKYGKDYYHMIMLAHNNVGYQNLLKMQTPSWQEGLKGKYPRLDYEILEKYHEGITVTTACLGGIVSQHILHGNIDKAKEELQTLVDIFGIDNVYIELQNHHQAEDKLVLPVLLDFHKQSGVKLLATSDSHYCRPGDYEAHDALLAISTKAKKDDHNRFQFANDEFYIPSQERMEEILPPVDFPDAIKNTVELAEKTEFTLDIGDDKKYLMPHIDVLPGMTESETLRERVYEGARSPKRYGDPDGNIPDHVKERIDYELDVISGMKFDGYFIIVADMIEDFAKKGIRVGPGRGCLHEDTLISTPNGWKPIKNVTVEDKVMSGNGEWCEIHDVLTHEAMPGEKLIKLSLSHGKTLCLTHKHKVLVHDAELGDIWRKSFDVSVGDSVAYVDGDSIEYNVVVHKDLVDASADIYDITVKNGDPSFLTEAGTVHNSAPGSVIVYCLGITNVDPFEHDLFFERFLNPDRISMPDIDVDVPNSKRAQCLSIMEERYGKGHVAHLSNYTTMGRKDTLNRVAKVYRVSTNLSTYMDDYCDINGMSLQDVAKDGFPMEISTKKEFSNVDMSTLQTVLDVAARLEGTLASYGVHASGIVVTSSPIDDNFPIRISSKAQLPVSQYDGRDVEDLGGIKIDILGLINLDQCEDAERNILMDLGEEVDSSTVPHDDKAVYDMLSTGDGGGVFQLGCLSGDTIIDGMSLKKMYLLRNSPNRKRAVRSVFLGEGAVKKNTVEDVVYSGVKEVHTLTTVSGESIVATEDHKFFTETGWKTLGELQSGDHVVVVDPSVGYHLVGDSQDVRGRVDVFDMFTTLHPDLMEVKREKVFTGFNTFHPDFRDAYPDHNNYYTIVVDAGYLGSVEQAQRINNDLSKMNLNIWSYNQIAEEYYEKIQPKMDDILLPKGTKWDKIESIVFKGEEETYDVMMRAPVHNFIANNIMVHNSSGMQSLMRVLQPQEFKDISALIALYRPGPMGMDTHNEYALRKNKGKKQTVLHPDMEKVLKKNYNLIVYQEDIMALSRLLAGYTGGEADTLRKATAKKNPAMMKQQEEKFIPAVNQKYGNDLGDNVWEMIKPFGAYAFNKSHSVAYGFTTYRTAWLKTHYPAQFAAAVIDNTKNDKLLPEFVWIRKVGLKIYSPDVNKSDMRSVSTKDSVQLPLYLIKNIGHDMAENIVKERERNGDYTSVVDFVSRNNINERNMVLMAKAGCFDTLGANRAAVVYNKDSIISASRQQASKTKMKTGLFGGYYDNSGLDDKQWTSDEAAPTNFVVDGVLMDVDEMLYAAWERESMGVLVGPHPFEMLFKHQKGLKIISVYPPITEFKKPNNSVKSIGFMTSVVVRAYTNKKGEKKFMTKFDLETNEGVVPGVLFKEIPEDKLPLYDNQFVYVEGKLENDNMDDSSEDSFSPNLIAYTIKPLDMTKIMAS